MLAKLALEGCVVTIDAMGTQTKIARTIRERGAQYVLCVKDNHPKLLDSIMFAGIGPAVRSHWEVVNRLHWCLVCSSMRISHGYVAAMLPTTWPSSTTS